MWLWTQVNKPLNKKLSIGVQYQIRLDNNLSSFKWSYYYFNVDFKVNKWLSTQAVLQFGDSYSKNLYSSFLAASTGKKFGKFGLSYRTAFQHEHNFLIYEYSDLTKSILVNEWRNRLTLKYALSHKIKLYAFSEPYIDFEVAGSRLSKVRNSVGVEYEFINNNFINPFILYQPDMQVTGRPVLERVLGFTYEYEFPYHHRKKQYSIDGTELKDAPIEEKNKQEIFH